MFLIDDLLLAPVSGFRFILEQIQQLADRELNDATVIKSELLELRLRLELEEITVAEYQEREAELFARLRAIRQRQMEAWHEAVPGPDSPSSLIIDTRLTHED